jgi:hypothetical protein
MHDAERGLGAKYISFAGTFMIPTRLSTGVEDADDVREKDNEALP